MTSPGGPVEGAIPSPNIWSSPDVYETENTGVDRAGVLDAALREVADWAGRDVLDVGCGAGFHLPRLAATARSVTGVEPHPPLVERARARVAGLRTASGGLVHVVAAGAAATGLPDASVDVVQARWAYFFGPGCEPGLAELQRVVRPGGTACVVDVDATRSTFGGWFRRTWPDYDADAVDRFWRRQGWTTERLSIDWSWPTREEFEAVLRIELSPGAADRVLAEDPERTGCDYGVVLRWRRY